MASPARARPEPIRLEPGGRAAQVGDGFLATFDSTSRAVRAATEIVNAANGIGLEVRTGVHVGEVEVRPDDVMVVGSGIEFTDNGEHELKGVPGTWWLYAVNRPPT